VLDGGYQTNDHRVPRNCSMRPPAEMSTIKINQARSPEFAYSMFDDRLFRDRAFLFSAGYV